jgi:hypothetical protein
MGAKDIFSSQSAAPPSNKAAPLVFKFNFERGISEESKTVACNCSVNSLSVQQSSVKPNFMNLPNGKSLKTGQSERAPLVIDNPLNSTASLKFQKQLTDNDLPVVKSLFELHNGSAKSEFVIE